MDTSIMTAQADYMRSDTTGSCWTCLSKSIICTQELPECASCLESGTICSGYAKRLQWPKIKRLRRYFNSRGDVTLAVASIEQGNNAPSYERRARFTLTSLSAFGVTSHEKRLIQHFANNVARIALAVDHPGNVYRSFIPIALGDAAILNSILAISAAHLSRWEGKMDAFSSFYMRRALIELEKRLQDPRLASSESTLATMLCLISIEVGNGSKNWRDHYQGVEGWLRSRTDTSKLDPFLKSWVFLVGFHAATVFGEKPSDVISMWLETSESQHDRSSQQVVDPFLGYSVELPRLLIKAASLQMSRNDSSLTEGELRCEIAILQQEIAACKLDTEKPILLASSCQKASIYPLPDSSVGQINLWRRTGATAEIFRHAAHIYVHRIGAFEGQTLPVEIQESVDLALELLALVPDVRGPGANLAWPLFVIGLELESPTLREIVLDRWQSLHLLGMKSSYGAERVLLETWRGCDSARKGAGVMKPWREVMHSLGEEQMVA